MRNCVWTFAFSVLLLAAISNCRPHLKCDPTDPACDPEMGLAFLSLLGSRVVAWPHSGLNNCYDDTIIFACPVSGFARQDGDSFRARKFVVSDDGTTVLDQETELNWQRCVLGHSWDGATCGGTAQSLTQSGGETACQALAASSSGEWRLPTFRELSTIHQYDGSSPALDLSVFIGTPVASGYWSSTPYLGNPGNAIATNLGTGAVISYSTALNRYIICVSGPNYANASFRVVQSGIVQDVETGSYWTTCPLMTAGALDTDAGCAGADAMETWSAALQSCANLDGTAGISGWRLPTLREMLSVPDFSSLAGSMMNDSFFPGAPTDVWTATTAVFNGLNTAFALQLGAVNFQTQTPAKTTTIAHYCISSGK